MLQHKNEPLSGQGQMMLAVFKALGLQPEQLSRMANGMEKTMQNVNMIAAHMPEFLARMEFTLKSLPAPEGYPDDWNAWRAYLDERSREHGGPNYSSDHPGSGPIGDADGTGSDGG